MCEAFGPTSRVDTQSLDELKQHQSTAELSAGFAKNQPGAGTRTLSWRNADIGPKPAARS